MFVVHPHCSVRSAVITYQGENGLDVVRDDLGRQELYERLQQVEPLVIVQLGRDQLLENTEQRLQLVAGDNLDKSK